MADLSLSYAGLLYLDRTLALLTGEVLPRNVTLHYHVFPRVEELFRRQARQAEFDVAEMSMSTFLVLTAHGDRRFIGLPCFPPDTSGTVRSTSRQPPTCDHLKISAESGSASRNTR